MDAYSVSRSPQGVELRMPLFGGQCELQFPDADMQTITIFAPAMMAEALRLQRIFNLYDPQSELSVLNRRRKVRASLHLRSVISRALEFSEVTQGAYDISKGHAFLARKGGQADRSVVCNYRDIAISGDRIELLHPDVLLDLGSIAKGYIADQLLAFVQDQGVEAALVDARGDIVLAGFTQPLEIQHPRNPAAALGKLALSQGAVATSGDYRQFRSNFAASHVLGARLISVTAVADNLCDADAAATALMVADQQQIPSLTRRFAGIRMLGVDAQLGLHYYNGFQDIFEPYGGEHDG